MLNIVGEVILSTCFSKAREDSTWLISLLLGAPWSPSTSCTSRPGHPVQALANVLDHLLQGFLSFRLEDVAVLNLARKIENQQGWGVLRDLAGGGTPLSELAETQPHHHHLLPCRCEKTAPETCLSNASPEAAS